MNREWTSLYLFLYEPADIFLNNIVRPFIDSLYQDDVIKSFFFVRYYENGHHIRLRLLAADKNIVAELEKRTMNFFDNQYAKYPKAITSNRYTYFFAQYVPEIARYGGIDFIYKAEDFFNKSSLTVLDIFRDNPDGLSYETKMGIAVKLHLSYAISVFRKREIISNFFLYFMQNWIRILIGKAYQSEEEVVQAFEQRLKMNRLALSSVVNNFFNIFETDQEITLDGWIGDWFTKVLNLAVIMRDKYGEIKKIVENNGVSPVFAINESIMHMTNNRLGIENKDEAFLAFLIYKITLPLNRS